ncbi:phosphatidylinositol-specific phospholipase C/glycerophosphodiester phosphodiesterase family protein [Streptomyces sp. NPDC087440]|uniref:phosphatidylinositol-specific phospholipase C/glycerophosphodiester phosphodiesterase family protein n=1 Tax=Streptomyces sp. NPDC087440 TaxID=3365790 RepID=UPI003801FF66
MSSLTTRRTAAAVLAGALVGAAGWASTLSAAGSPYGPQESRRPERPLRRAHAHNDYLHERPLLDALDHGFTSVEADIHLVDGQLLVAHDPAEVDPARTLEALYLDPLAALVRKNHGTVHPGHHRPLHLLVDIKTQGAATYRELHRRLHPYRRMLSTYGGGRVRLGAVTPVVSGDRAARAPMEAQRTRYAFYDGRLPDLATSAPASFIPLISSNWAESFTWSGTGPFPRAEQDKLHALVRGAHHRSRRVRFWGTPDTPGPARDALWHALLAARVDHINTDDLTALEKFLRAYDPEAGGQRPAHGQDVTGLRSAGT